MDSPVHCLVQIGVIEDDVGTLASEFESDVLQVALCCSLHDLPSDEGATSEGDLVDLGVRRDGSTNGVAVAGDDVDNTGRETGLVNELAHADGG
jgi:hypothetical protein